MDNARRYRVLLEKLDALFLNEVDGQYSGLFQSWKNAGLYRQNFR